MDDTLDQLARAYGIQPHYVGIDERPAEAPEDAVIALLRALGVAARTRQDRERALAAAPKLAPSEMRAPADARCFRSPFLDTGRAWGVTCQLYGLVSKRDWGIGDFEDLARLAECLGPLGADFVGVSPLHALFLAAPARASPFSPSSRAELNPLLIAPDRIAGFDPARDVDEAALARARAGALIDYPAVARTKLAALRRLFDRRARDDDDFAAFISAEGDALRGHAVFQALSLEMTRCGHGAGWTAWPEPLRHSDSAEVADFARAHAQEIDFQFWLQWQAERQLGDAAARARAAGMRIGLYLDLAVGAAPDGAATWRDPALSVAGVEVGAPPDLFNTGGQNWGLAPMAPAEIAARDFMPVRRAYGAVSRHAGAVRIDHAMSLHRLFWIPQGFSPAEGAYVLYPMPDMVRALADASREARALVIGEDLGVVPQGFREEMDAAGILGSTVFFFEQQAGRFRPPRDYRRNTLACIGSHDTATLAGWWRGDDIALRRDLNLHDDAAADEARRARDREREGVRDLLAEEGLISGGEADDDPALAVAIHRLVARGPARLFAVQIEDLLGVAEQANVPGTVDEYPNWRRRLPVAIEELTGTARFRAIIEAVARERPR